MLSDAPRETRPGRPVPKHPEVLVTTAATGDGVPELMAALDRHRATARGSDGASTRAARAEAQIWAVLADRLHERARTIEAAPIAAALLLSVAAHELDPYEAADRLLEIMAGAASPPAPVPGSSTPGSPGPHPRDRD
jgi:LAO/AO transport system kinase